MNNSLQSWHQTQPPPRYETFLEFCIDHPNITPIHRLENITQFEGKIVIPYQWKIKNGQADRIKELVPAYIFKEGVMQNPNGKKWYKMYRLIPYCAQDSLSDSKIKTRQIGMRLATEDELKNLRSRLYHVNEKFVGNSRHIPPQNQRAWRLINNQLEGNNIAGSQTYNGVTTYI